MQTNRAVLNRAKPIELVLELLSFSGGENTVGEDQALKNNEARIIENWDALSIGGMIRSKGFNEVADGGAGYTNAPDLLAHHHEEGGGTQVYLIVEGDLVKKDGTGFTLLDDGAFTSGILSHAVSAGDKFWITNTTDGLKYTTIGGAIAIPASIPTSNRARIYHSKYRLLAEGGGRRVYGSRAGSGNWTVADAWSLANDAFNIDLPDETFGMAIDFPSGSEDLVFTYFAAYSLFNYPDVAFRKILNSRGCCAPLSIAKGDEGVYFFSNHPSRGIFLYNGSEFIELTINCDFIDNVNLAGRIFGIYKDGCYYFVYNESGSGVSYPNRMRIYDATLGRWMSRPVNEDLSDNFGYPALLKYDNNELYCASSQKDKLYELETEDNSDEGQNTEANYKTKDFTSADFNVASGGGRFPIDEVRLKLTKIVLSAYGTKGAITIQWTADRGAYSGSQTFNLIADGDIINDTFIVNTSKVITLPPTKTIIKTLANSAIGYRFNFQIMNSNTGERPEVKKIKIHAIALQEK